MGIFSYFAVVLEEARRIIGEMLEWLKRHAWKACIRQKRIGGSNPPYSAKKPLQVFCNGFFADGTEVYYGGVK